MHISTHSLLQNHLQISLNLKALRRKKETKRVRGNIKEGVRA